MAEGGCGLDPVLCDLCEDKAAQFFCRTCDGNMCVDCKDDHKRKKMFLRHDVVKMTLTRKMEIDGYGPVSYCVNMWVITSSYNLCTKACIYISSVFVCDNTSNRFCNVKYYTFH